MTTRFALMHCSHAPTGSGVLPYHNGMGSDRCILRLDSAFPQARGIAKDGTAISAS